MKKQIIFIMSSILAAVSISAQAPASFNYQAVLRDASGTIISSEAVSLEVSILLGSIAGDIIFTETHETQTNQFGLVNIQVGSVNSLQDIPWGGNKLFLRTTVNGNYMGATQLVSVPYAMHAGSSADGFSGDYNHLDNLPDLSGFINLPNPQEEDMAIYRNNQWQKIPVGEEGEVLTIVDGKVAWAAPADNGDDDNGDNGNGDNGNGGNGDNTVTDIDGNLYNTVVIGEQEWMASNLRTKHYNNGIAIPGINVDKAAANNQGQYTFHPYQTWQGLDSEEEVLSAYGKLYNWYAATNPGGLCPTGWRVPSASDVNKLINYLVDNYDDINHTNVGQKLKSCRQVNSPLGGDCTTNEHPRWNGNYDTHGTDDFGFFASPSGYFSPLQGGLYLGVGFQFSIWTSTSTGSNTAANYDLWEINHDFAQWSTFRSEFLSIRCVRDAVE